MAFLADGSVRARSLLTVAGWILNSRAASAAVLSPFDTVLRISTCVFEKLTAFRAHRINHLTDTGA
jgi:hypothetical protein